MNKTPIAVLLIVTAATLVAAAQARPDNAGTSPDVLLKAAANRELIDGNVERAIAEYQEIASRYRATHPEIAAEALVRLARSHERIESPDAASIYRRVLSEFAETREAATARVRLAALDGTAPATAQSGSPVPVRLLQSDSLVVLTSVSADGRVAAGVAWSWSDEAAAVVESLVAVNVHTGAQTVLVPGSAGTQVFGAALSPDGSRVAYASREGGVGAGRRSSLSVVELESSVGPTVLSEEPAPGLLWPVGWTRDGQAVFAQRRPTGRATDRATRLLRIPAVGGPIDEIAAFPQEREVTDIVAVAPDGLRVAFSAKPRPGTADQYIYVLDSSAGTESAVVRVAGTKSGIVWSTDGQRLLYRNGSNGRSNLWSVDVFSDGTASEPTLLQGGLPPGMHIGATTSGDLLFGRVEGAGVSVVVRSRGASVQSEDVFGPGSLPVLSPDGSAVAFRGAELTVRQLATREERRFPKDGLDMTPPVWTHDGRSLVVYARSGADDGRPGGGFYRLDLGSSTYVRLFSKDTDDWVRSNTFAVSRDDRMLITLARPQSEPGAWTALVGIDLATGVQRELTTFNEPIRSPLPIGLSLSPDGEAIAIMPFGPVDGRIEGRLLIARLDSPQIRQLVSPLRLTVPLSGVPMPAWTADGSSILFGALNDQGAFQVMQVSAAGGRPVPDGPSLAEVSYRRVSPSDGGGISASLDGSSLAFQIAHRAGFELWSLDTRPRR